MSYLLIGLGNPGKKFELTRHNAGKMLARWLKAEGRRPKDEGRRMPEGFEIMETECFMNESGRWVHRNISNFKFQISNLIIAHDDLDIPLGKFKIQFGKGPRQHKGILSVEQALGTGEFWRVRIGIASEQFLKRKVQSAKCKTKTQNSKLNNIGEKYVLASFSADERKTLESVFPEIRNRLMARHSYHSNAFVD